MRVTILSFVLLSFLLCSNFVWASSWVEVTRFTGSAGQDTPYFTCNHTEWRISWNYTSDPQFPESSGIVAYAYDNHTELVTLIAPGIGINATHSGLTYVHNNQGTFYLKIIAENVTSYTFIIEQDIDSIPEFSSMFLLSLFATGIFVAMILTRRQVRHHSQSQR